MKAKRKSAPETLWLRANGVTEYSDLPSDVEFCLLVAIASRYSWTDVMKFDPWSYSAKSWAIIPEHLNFAIGDGTKFGTLARMIKKKRWIIKGRDDCFRLTGQGAAVLALALEYRRELLTFGTTQTKGKLNLGRSKDSWKFLLHRLRDAFKRDDEIQTLLTEPN
jgi:hypothetical protein